MARLGLVTLALAWGIVASVAIAQTDEVVLGKKGSQWIEILKTHKETKYRRASLIALELIGGKSRGVTAALYEALERDTEPEVRRETALLLNRMGAEARGAARELVETIRRDKSAAVRAAAAKSLGGRLKDQSRPYVPEIIELLKDQDAGVRAALVEAMRDLEDAAVPALPRLMKLAKEKNEDRFTRLYSIQIISLQGLESPEAGKFLREIFEDKTDATNLREIALEGLARREDTGFALLFGGALDEKEVKIRQVAAGALAKLGGKAREAWPAIQKGLKDPDPLVRLQLIRGTGALSRSIDDAITSLGEAAVKDDATENVLAAVQELADLGRRAEKTAPVLTRLAENDTRASIRQAAADALKKIQTP